MITDTAWSFTGCNERTSAAKDGCRFDTAAEQAKSNSPWAFFTRLSTRRSFASADHPMFEPTEDREDEEG